MGERKRERWRERERGRRLVNASRACPNTTERVGEGEWERKKEREREREEGRREEGGKRSTKAGEG